VRYFFEDYQLDSGARELTRHGRTVPLEPQAFDLLAYLIEQRDRVVGHDELLQAVWGTRYVSESALTTRIKEIRRALEDDGRSQRTVRTLHRRGYRFVAEASEGRTSTGVSSDVEGHAASLGADAPRGRSEQVIRFCTASDGTRLAFATSGTGPPFVKAANWLSHLEFDLQSPVWRHLATDLAPGRTIVRYDERGSGLSDWETDRFDVEAWAEDLGAVVDALELDRFPLLGISQGGAVAVMYAVTHPERVSHLILQGAYARGRNWRGERGRAEAAALAILAREGWGKDGAFAKMFSARLIQHGDLAQVGWLTDLQRISTSVENAVRFREAFSDINVEALLPQVRVPTLVLHSRGDQAAPFDEGRWLAAGIPGARFVPLESDNHLILEDEPAWEQYQSAVRAFLAE
jgi:DNA-binding winged helix-turn-helix (wHTH) protein/pimeloyl-ACP methyl ester carboxylesterase